MSEDKNPFTKQVDIKWEKNNTPENPFKHLEEDSWWKDEQEWKKSLKKRKKKISIWLLLLGIFILFLFF